MVADRVAMATQSRMSQAGARGGRGDAAQPAARPAPRRRRASRSPRATSRATTVRSAATGTTCSPCPSGAVCVVVGDVVGHGLAAAQAMSQIRSVLRPTTLRTDDPAQALADVDAHVRHFQPHTMATVLFGVIDPGTEVLRLSSAGHPPPVLALPGDETAVLKLDADLPLGVELGHARHNVEVALPPGAVLCLYSDGLVERRGRPHRRQHRAAAQGGGSALPRVGVRRRHATAGRGRDAARRRRRPRAPAPPRGRTDRHRVGVPGMRSAPRG